MRRLRDAGITVQGALAPLLYCKPERFAKLLKDAADGVYIGEMALPRQNRHTPDETGQSLFQQHGIQGTAGRHEKVSGGGRAAEGLGL